LILIDRWLILIDHDVLDIDLGTFFKFPMLMDYEIFYGARAI
jgi:hypothetical protein